VTDYAQRASTQLGKFGEVVASRIGYAWQQWLQVTKTPFKNGDEGIVEAPSLREGFETPGGVRVNRYKFEAELTRW
jgi:hypothetical protein